MEKQQRQIVHVTSVHQRGDSRIFQKEVHSLARQWPGSVHLIVMDGHGDSVTKGIRIVDLGSTPKMRLGRFLTASWRLFRHLRQTKPTVIHFHDPELLPVFFLLQLLGATVIYDAHEDLPKQIATKHWIPQYLRRPVAVASNFVEKQLAGKLAAVVTVTPTIEANFVNSRTVLVRNFPILEAPMEPPNKGVSEQTSSFTYIGGLQRPRGTHEMVAAIATLNGKLDREQIPRARLDLAGRFSPESLQHAVSTSPGWESTKFHGYLDTDDVMHLIANACAGLVLLHPIQSYMEAYPIKMFEYMAAGIPVIASDFPVYREIVEGAGCGLLVDPLDISAIVNAMYWIVQHQEESTAMGLRGRIAVQEHYNWASESQSLISLYQDILKLN